MVKAAYTLHHGEQEDWVRKEHESTEFEKEVCEKMTERYVKKQVLAHKDSRAPGIDEIPTRLFKNATPLFYTRLTTLVNECLETGMTPECLNTGKMSLIAKKEASLKVINKRPITVSSLILSVITKTLNEKMLKVCERENLFGDTQYGFRPGRSTTDCIFLLLTAVKKARKKKFKISVAFCDLQKAYDSVDREILYKKLHHSGFGGKVLSLIQSMYYNDTVKIKIWNTLSSPLWFTRGVKQGCALSPLLFALYIAGLGVKLQETQPGVEVGGMVLTGMFFAVSKTFVLSTGPTGRRWNVGTS